MNTEALEKQFGSYYPKLTDVAKYFLHKEETTVLDDAARGKIPFKIFKASNSQKAPWIVSVEDLAMYLEERRNSFR